MPEIGANIGIKADESPRLSDRGHRQKRRGTAGFGAERDRADVQPLPGAEWREIDGNVWTIPLDRLKDSEHRKEPFRIPLTPRGVAILAEMRGSGSNFVFPGQKSGKPLSNMALLSVVQRMNALATPAVAKGEPDRVPFWHDPATRRAIVPHGFRATFRTWAEETTLFSHATIEQAMGHAIGSESERAYRRTDVLARRRELMAAWEGQCTENMMPTGEAR